MDEFYQQLIDEQEKKRKLKRYLDERTQLVTQLGQVRSRERELFQKLEAEKVDVEKLESFSIANIFYTLTGRKDEKLDQEKQELVSAQLHYEEAKSSVEDLESDVKELDRRIADLGDPEAKYHEILEQKYVHLLDSNNEKGEEAHRLLEKIGIIKDEQTEIEEALDAGHKVNRALSSAGESLKKAQNWGTVDMFGGGLVSTSLKHSHIDDAKRATHEAQRLLRKFSHELSDIGKSFNANIEISGGLTFADYFLDGLVMDWFVQDKINQSAREVESMLQKVSQTIQQLKKLKQEVASTEKQAERQWESIILQA
ncbi:hypothetical protein SAMN04487944_11181 [Gracilibacillus ureilyticus]|uniref:Uncharacterized protein n=1 Tax=Gracilibacillus ureilyticus TaxID=531814 RepID=A0A1H9SLV1_9BACI|nr:hypothetical protein [Gracilibacillus ureilyticus]SER85894.1 hypothetical protein SAMN04487944_11181 [Gracilibacillus ureilyticus]